MSQKEIDVLYGIVKKQNPALYDDYKKVREHVEDY